MMSRNISKRSRAIIAAIAAIALTGLAGCAGQGDTAAQQPAPAAPSQSSSSASAPAGTSERFATNLDEYIDQILRQDSGQAASEWQKTVLQNAKGGKGISASDYEKAWSNYTSCMTGKGYKPFNLDRYPNGIYHMPARMTGTPAQEQKYRSDYYDRYYANVDALDSVYSMQVGNPSLIKDQDEAIVDCLKRDNLVDKSYTASDLRRERGLDGGKGRYSFDRRNMSVRGCLVANGWVSSHPDEYVAELW